MTDRPHVLVVNAGSSSLKYRLVDATTGDAVASGQVSQIGDEAHWMHEGGAQEHDEDVDCPDQDAAFALARDAVHGPDSGLDEDDLVGVGHRVVHGGPDLRDPVLVDDAVVEAVRALAPLAPLHNPANAEGMARARQAFPSARHVAVFDTGFHRTLPEAAHTYAVPARWREGHHVRRYGFHGSSYAYVSRRTARLMDRPPEDLRMVVLHLGNGASACAVDRGRSVETSMGLSPTEGLVMGTRSGDVDPALGGYLNRVAGLDAAEVDDALTHDSGLLALLGESDFRVLQQRMDEGDAAACLAFDVVVHRIRKYVGAYATVLDGLEALVFTGGVGEHSAPLRSAVVEGLGVFGATLDPGANDDGPAERRISAAASRVEVWVVPTDEEREIARETARLLDLDPDW